VQRLLEENQQQTQVTEALELPHKREFLPVTDCWRLMTSEGGCYEYPRDTMRSGRQLREGGHRW
jgi:hypothetical protein